MVIHWLVSEGTYSTRKMTRKEGVSADRQIPSDQLGRRHELHTSIASGDGLCKGKVFTGQAYAPCHALVTETTGEPRVLRRFVRRKKKEKKSPTRRCPIRRCNRDVGPVGPKAEDLKMAHARSHGHSSNRSPGDPFCTTTDSPRLLLQILANPDR